MLFCIALVCGGSASAQLVSPTWHKERLTQAPVSPSTCGPKPSTGQFWFCVDEKWVHSGDLTVVEEWKEPRYGASAGFSEWLVSGDLHLLNNLLWQGSAIARIRATGCIFAKPGAVVLFDWSPSGMPDGYGSGAKTSWHWILLQQSSSNHCTTDLSKISVDIVQGGCTNAACDATQSNSTALIANFRRSTRVCLRNGLLIAFLLGVPFFILSGFLIYRTIKRGRAMLEPNGYD